MAFPTFNFRSRSVVIIFALIHFWMQSEAFFCIMKKIETEKIFIFKCFFFGLIWKSFWDWILYGNSLALPVGVQVKKKGFSYEIAECFHICKSIFFDISCLAIIDKISSGDSPLFPLLHSSLHHVMAKIEAHLFKWLHLWGCSQSLDETLFQKFL